MRRLIEWAVPDSAFQPTLLEQLDRLGEWLRLNSLHWAVLRQRSEMLLAALGGMTSEPHQHSDAATDTCWWTTAAEQVAHAERWLH